MCVRGVCSHVCLCIWCLWGSEGFWSRGTGVIDGCELACAGTQSARTASDLNCPAISPAPGFCLIIWFLKCWNKLIVFGKQGDFRVQGAQTAELWATWNCLWKTLTWHWNKFVGDKEREVGKSGRVAKQTACLPGGHHFSILEVLRAREVCFYP